MRYDPSLDPIIRLGLSGPQGLAALRELADLEIKRELETLPGVAAVKVRGGLEEEIHVALNESQMALLKVDIGVVNTKLQQANVNVPGGLLREGQTLYLVRTLNEFQSIEQIRDLIVAAPGGAPIRLRHIADVSWGHEDREMISRVDGRESVEIQVFKEADANVVSVAEAVRERGFGRSDQQAYVARLAEEERAADSDTTTAAWVDAEGTAVVTAERDSMDDDEEPGEEAEKYSADDGEREKHEQAMHAIELLRMTSFIGYNLPEETTIEILSDQSEFILEAIGEVQKSALIGGCIAVAILFLFLRGVVHTAVVGVTIPVSVVATFAPMFMFDVSLNIMSLGGLALGIGMLVDNSIVVFESILRCREEGDDLLTATVRGTQAVGGAVAASTVTTIAVFFPIVFVEGIAGQVFGDMALTVVFSLLASLAVALYLIPMLASRRLASALDADVVDDGQAGALIAPHSVVPSTGPGVLGGEFLWPQALEVLKQRLASEGGAIAALALVPAAVLSFGLRLLVALLASVAAAVKAAALLPMPVLWPLARLVELWVRPQRSFFASVSHLAGSGGALGASAIDRLWPGLLVFTAPVHLQQGVTGLLSFSCLGDHV